MNIAVMDRESRGAFRRRLARELVQGSISTPSSLTSLRMPRCAARLALKLTDSPIVKGAENIRRYWAVRLRARPKRRF